MKTKLQALVQQKKRAAGILETLLGSAGAVPRLPRDTLAAVCRLADLISTDSTLLPLVQGKESFAELARGQTGTEADARYNRLAGLCLLRYGTKALDVNEKGFLLDAAEGGETFEKHFRSWQEMAFYLP